MTDATFTAALMDAVVLVLAYVIAGVTAGLVLFVLFIGIRKGLDAMRAASYDPEDEQTWHHRYGWISEEKAEWLFKGYDTDYGAALDVGATEQEAEAFAESRQDGWADSYDDVMFEHSLRAYVDEDWRHE